MEINQIRELVAKSKVSEALQMLQENISDDLQNDVILLSIGFFQVPGKFQGISVKL